MKFSAVAAVLIVSIFATSMALPAYKRMAYYQQPAIYYQARSSPQRLMYLQQYVQQPASPHTHARSTAFVAGDAVAAGSVLKEDAAPASVEQQNAEESALNGAGINEDQPYPAAGGQVSAEFEGTFADGGVDAGAYGAADAPAVSIAASAEVPEAPELPEVPELPEASELPEAPVVDNQVLDDDYTPSAAVPEISASSAESLPSDDAAKVPREYNFETPAPAAPEPAVAPVAEEAVPEVSAVPEVPALPEIPALPSANPEQAPAEEAPSVAAQVPLAAAPAVPAVVSVAKPSAVAPPKRYLPPKRKISVKLDEQSEAASDDDDEFDADSYRPSRVPSSRRPVKGSGTAVANKGTKGQLPAGTFFPINFGGTSGGAIAIANSFSTGEGGSATSHAIAYGSPDVARAKARPVRRH